MDEKLKATLQKIELLSKQNEEFANEMRKMFGKTSSAQVFIGDNKVASDVSAIREALDIRANNSIDYSFVDDQRTRDQLYIDNLRMENAALDLKNDDVTRFYNFCANAFYQIENIVNYYLFRKYPEIEDLLDFLEDITKDDIFGTYDARFFRRSWDKNISDIAIEKKINAVHHVLFPGDKMYSQFLTNIRKVRNEGSHRCQVIHKEKDKKNPIYNFFYYNRTVNVRENLRILVNEIKSDLSKKTCNESLISTASGTVSADNYNVQTQSRESEVMPPAHVDPQTIQCKILSSTLGAYFVDLKGKRERVPEKNCRKLKDKNEGDYIKVKLSDGKIKDVLSD